MMPSDGTWDLTLILQMRHPSRFEYNGKICIIDKIAVVVAYAIQKSCFGVSGVLICAV